jgi:hypothetical protein
VDTEGDAQEGAAGAGAPATWRNDTPSSGDSAISSPMTDSCLASPVFGLDDGCEGAVPGVGNEKSVNGRRRAEEHSGKRDELLSEGRGEGNKVDTDLKCDKSEAFIDGAPQMRLMLPQGWKQCEGAFYHRFCTLLITR